MTENKKKVWDFFEKALKDNNVNAYAALGIGILMAETGNVEQAAQSFRAVWYKINVLAMHLFD